VFVLFVCGFGDLGGVEEGYGGGGGGGGGGWGGGGGGRLQAAWPVYYTPYASLHVHLRGLTLNTFTLEQATGHQTVFGRPRAARARHREHRLLRWRVLLLT